MAILKLSNFFKSTPGAGFGLQFLRKLLVAFLEILTIVDYQFIQTVWGHFGCLQQLLARHYIGMHRS